MHITQLSVNGYRSSRNAWLRLRQVNVIIGPNGTGKSNLYRALFLLAAAANGRFARTLAEEGESGFSSFLSVKLFVYCFRVIMENMNKEMRTDRFSCSCSHSIVIAPTFSPSGLSRFNAAMR